MYVFSLGSLKGKAIYYIYLIVRGISLTADQLINKFFPDCLNACNAFPKLFYAQGR